MKFWVIAILCGLVALEQPALSQSLPKFKPRPLTESEAGEVRSHNLDPTGMTIEASLPVIREPTAEEWRKLKEKGVDTNQLPSELEISSDDTVRALRELIEKGEKEEAKIVLPGLQNVAIVMDSFMGTTNAAIKGSVVSVKADALKFRLLGKTYEYSGNFTIMLDTPREHKNPRFGFGSPETAKLVMLENFSGEPVAMSNATIWEKRKGFINFVAMGKEWIYSGKYTLQN